MKKKLSYFELLNGEVNNGLSGINEGLSFGFKRLDNYVTLRKATNYLFGGYTGSAKTTCVDEIFVLNAFDQIIKDKLAGKIKITYWSMERRREFKFARWFSRKCFLDHGVRIPMHILLGWVKKTERLTKDQHDLFLSYSDYFDALEEVVEVTDGRQNPTGIRKYMKKLAEENGVIHEISEFSKVYEPNNPKLILLNIFDHVGKLKKEVKMANDKELVDTFSDDISNIYRDFYGMSNVIVSQFNRSISNPLRLKAQDVTPMLEDFKTTSDMAEDADVVMSIFDPWRYGVADPSGYDLTQLRDDSGSKFYRNLQILKNSFGKEDVRIGLAYEPEMGILREMPQRKIGESLSSNQYESIRNGSFFIPQNV